MKADSGSPHANTRMWWCLVLSCFSIGPLLFLATSWHVGRSPLLEPSIQAALGSLHEQGSLEQLIAAADRLRSSSTAAVEVLAKLHQHAQQTGQLTAVACPGSDPSVHQHLDRSSRLMVCADLHNSGAIMPNLVAQLTEAVSALPPANVFVSIYESGSTDATALWLQHLRLWYTKGQHVGSWAALLQGQPQLASLELVLEDEPGTQASQQLAALVQPRLTQLMRPAPRAAPSLQRRQVWQGCAG